MVRAALSRSTVRAGDARTSLAFLQITNIIGEPHEGHSMATTQAIEFIQADQLRLDPHDPRLPEGADKWSQSKILGHLKDTGVLEELAYSLAAEGFFVNEPLTVVWNDKLNGYITLEGNRRVATLMILLVLPSAGDEQFFDIELDAKAREHLQEIPCIVVTNRNDVDSFVGFRHIGGLKTWSLKQRHAGSSRGGR